MFVSPSLPITPPVFLPERMEGINLILITVFCPGYLEWWLVTSVYLVLFTQYILNSVSVVCNVYYLIHHYSQPVWAEHHYQTIHLLIQYPLYTGSRLHQFSKVLDPIDSHQFRPLPSCPHHIWAKSRPINASSQFVQRILDNKVSNLVY